MISKLKIKQPILLIIPGVIFIVTIFFFFDRFKFITFSEHVTGIVTHISIQNSRCGGRIEHYDCTVFIAYVDFATLEGVKSSFSVGGGIARGYNQPMSYSSRSIGGLISVVYDPSDISRVYEDELWDIWGVPITILYLQIMSFIPVFAEPKKKYNT